MPAQLETAGLSLVPSATANCRQCANFVIAPGELEDLIPGLNIVSSAYGSVRADTGYCTYKDVFLTAAVACPGFKMQFPAADTA